MKKIVNDAFNLTDDKHMLVGELDLLDDTFREAYQGGDTLEVGAYKGMTSYIMANIVDELGSTSDSKHYIVDVFDNKSQVHTKEMLLKNVSKFKDRVVAIKSASLGFGSTSVILDKTFDYVFIDGDHRYPVLYLELCMVEFTAERIFAHDYGHAGVTKAVDRFCKERNFEAIRLVPKDGATYGLIEVAKKK